MTFVSDDCLSYHMTSFVDPLCFLSVVWYAYVRVCLYVPCGLLLGKS